MTTFIDLTMRPNAAMAERQRWLAVAGLAAIMLVGAVRFVLLGAWPVAVFGVADVALLGWALHASARAAGVLEEVRLVGDRLSWRAMVPGQAARTEWMEPLAARVELEAVAPRGNRLWLAERGRRVAVGVFLSADERAEVAAVLRGGLERWHRQRGR